MNYKFFSLAIGFTIWFIATVTFRIAGHHFFLTEDKLIISLLYLALIPFLGVIATWTFNKYKLNKFEAIHSAVIMVLPGMFLDTFCIKFFESIFPNLQEKDGVTFGSWLMFAYSIVLFFGLIRKKKK